MIRTDKNISNKNFKILELPTFSDERGFLTVLESALPFEIKRSYWINGREGVIRGGHRHHFTRQALIAVTGSVTIFVDDGVMQSTICLDHPNKCLLVEPKDWHTMAFECGAVLLVFASHHYDINDYIDEPYA